MKNSKFAALFMAASIIISGCEIEEGALAGVQYEKHETWEKSVKVGYRTDDGINENSTFKIDDEVTVVIDNGNKEYGTNYMHIYLYKVEGEFEYTLFSYEEHKDPSHAWSRFSLNNGFFDGEGYYTLRVYLGEDYFGEVDFEIVE